VTDALVLRAVDFGESDASHLLTPDSGRLTAIAKGAKRSRRRFPGTHDVFNLLRVQVAPRRRPGTLARLEQAQLVDWHPGLRDRPALP
jgi:DNA repair protein RecO (recombination protein O)